MTTLAEIAVVLETSEKNVVARLRGMKMLPVCNRCGGTGQYSFNGEHSRCYGCEGSGVRAPKAGELDGILADAEASKVDGRFAAYQRYLAASKVVKNAQVRVMDAWQATGISAAYDWRKSFGPNGNPYDVTIAAINCKMHDAHKAVTDASHNLKTSSPTYTADVVAFAALVTEALATIEAARLELEEKRQR